MRNVLLTGASRGIGKAIKELLEQNGYCVFAPTRQELDLADPTQISKYLQTLAPVDILINCAGINELAGIDELTAEQLERSLQINLKSQLQLITGVCPHMKQQKWGRIVNFSSIWCQFSKPRRLSYCMAKAGVTGLTVATAVELAPYNILVNAVAPGFVNTEMTSQNNTPQQIAQLAEALPIKRLADPKEIAELVVFLISDKNSFMTGQTLFIDGGFSCI